MDITADVMLRNSNKTCKSLSPQKKLSLHVALQAKRYLTQDISQVYGGTLLYFLIIYSLNCLLSEWVFTGIL